jgi:hypothetical protein
MRPGAPLPPGLTENDAPQPRVVHRSGASFVAYFCRGSCRSGSPAAAVMYAYLPLQQLGTQILRARASKNTCAMSDGSTTL